MTLDKGFIEQFLQKDVKMAVGTVGYKVTGKITAIDDLGVLLIDNVIKGERKRYFPHFNIIEIEEIEKE